MRTGKATRTARALFTRADRALYKAKEAGRDGLEIDTISKLRQGASSAFVADTITTPPYFRSHPLCPETYRASYRCGA